MVSPAVYCWKRSPFIRLVLPFMTGILLEREQQFPVTLLLLIGCITFLTLVGFFFLPFFDRYKLSFSNGLVTFIFFSCLGALFIFNKDFRHSGKWFGHFYRDSCALLVTLTEPPVEKIKSVKAEAAISYVINGNRFIPANGRVILYFKKDSLLHSLSYGSQLLLKKSLQEIKNTGNPGAFDYKTYCHFQGITHQAYLEEDEFEILTTQNKNGLTEFIFSAKEKILIILRKYIKKEKELGLAEALLIGYKDDLDKSLVQSYSNTGVVHIIAISGLHLGLIYWLLVKLFQPLKKRRQLRWLSSLLIITGLWLFSLLAGGQPSVLRSALMFSCIVAGEGLTRRTNIYNSLALSAFMLLCYNPYWLWDVGFQLSYAAVLSIVIFMRPVYNLLYFKNKLADAIWKLNAVTIAAQVLTIPLSIYYFHQFPNYFLFTNLVAVPLSSIILIGEIFLCLIAFLPGIAILTGKILAWLIGWMNTYIERTELLPFSIWSGLNITAIQAMLLFTLIAGVAYWLMEQSKAGLLTGLIALLGFAALRSGSLIQTNNQQTIIVYNIPQKKAIDFFEGHHYFFTGDSSLQQDDPARNFHLKPSRILHRSTIAGIIPDFILSGNHISWKGKHILLLDTTLSFIPAVTKETIDLLIFSKKPAISMNDLDASFNIKLVIFDASVPAWKARQWQRDCDRLRIAWHDVTVKGAFAMSLR